jgi:hypothetical protein
VGDRTRKIVKRLYSIADPHNIGSWPLGSWPGRGETSVAETSVGATLESGPKREGTFLAVSQN